MKFKFSKSGLLASLLWVVGFLIAFIIPPGSHFIWVPDALLLFGFWPLLIGGRARWLWLVFGILNMIIGWHLAMSTVLDDAKFAPYHLVEIKKHLALYHPFMTWLLIGFVCTIIGLIRLFLGLIKWLMGKLNFKLSRRKSG